MSSAILALCVSCTTPTAAHPRFQDDPEDPSESSEELAQDLTNPLANLVTIPIQANFDNDIGPLDDGSRTRTNVQPVIPFELNDDWNLISRTIVPIVSQEDVFPGAGSQFGLGDTTVSLFASPKQPTEDGWIWGAGPAFLLPTATNNLLGGDQWGVGPTAVAVRMDGPWTYGALGNHIWSVAGDSNRRDVNASFAQPFVAYTWPSAWTASMQSEVTYDWKSSDWGVPVNATVSKLLFLGKLPISIQAGAGYWLDETDGGPEGWRYRLQANFVLARW